METRVQKSAVSMSYLSTRDVLALGVERAKGRYEIAHQEFKQAINDIPSSLPPPDGTGKIKLAGNEYRFAMRGYSDALREYNNFVAYGQIPERLRVDKESGY